MHAFAVVLPLHRRSIICCFLWHAFCINICAPENLRNELSKRWQPAPCFDLATKISGILSFESESSHTKTMGAWLLVTLGETSNSTCKKTFLTSNLYPGLCPNLYSGSHAAASAALVCTAYWCVVLSVLQLCGNSAKMLYRVVKRPSWLLPCFGGLVALLSHGNFEDAIRVHVFNALVHDEYCSCQCQFGEETNTHVWGPLNWIAFSASEMMYISVRSWMSTLLSWVLRSQAQRSVVSYRIAKMANLYLPSGKRIFVPMREWSHHLKIHFQNERIARFIF